VSIFSGTIATGSSSEPLETSRATSYAISPERNARPMGPFFAEMRATWEAVTPSLAMATRSSASSETK